MKDKLRQRTVSWDDPAKLASIAAGMSGLDYLRAMRDGVVDHPPISLLVDFMIIEVEEGIAVFQQGLRRGPLTLEQGPSEVSQDELHDPGRCR